MKLIVYTAIFGGINDKLHPPKNMSPEVECVAFVDKQVFTKHGGRHRGWTLRRPIWEHATKPRLRARRHKLLAHQAFPGVDYTLWVDGCLTPKVDPWQLVERYLQDADLALFRHMQRNCVYKELEACLRLRKDDPATMRRQVDRYRRAGYPYNHGLAETTALLRRHTFTATPPPVLGANAFCEQWWEELRANSVRDQLSFNYLAWKLGVRYNTLRGNRCRCPYFDWRPHR